MKLKKMKNEYVYSIFTKALSILLSFIQSIIVARYLGVALKGTTAYIQGIISVGSIVITFGIHQAYPYFRKKYGKERIYNDYISITVLLYLLYFIISILFTTFLINSIELKVSALLIPLLGYANVMSYVCLIETPNIRNRWWTIINFINVVFNFLLWIFTKSNFTFAIILLLFEDLLKCIIYTLLLKPKVQFHKGLFNLTIELFKMGFLPMMALLMTTLNYKIDIFMLKTFDFIEVSQIGVYSIGMLFADKVALIPDTLKGVLVSKLSKGADEHEVAKVSRICFWSTLLVCFVFLLLGKNVINMFYGKDYNGAYEVLMICSFGTIFIGYFKLIAQYNIVNKKQIRNIILLSVSILINILLNYILIPKYELAGAAFASGFGYLLSGLIFVFWFAISNKIKISEMFVIQKSDLKIIKNGKKGGLI